MFSFLLLVFWRFLVSDKVRERGTETEEGRETEAEPETEGATEREEEGGREGERTSGISWT